MSDKKKFNKNNGELDKYIKDIARYSVLSEEQEKVLFNKIIAGDDSLRTSLIESNLRFVILIAHRYNTGNIPLQDLVNDGNIGLVTAANMFNPAKGVKFITYAYLHVMGAILKSIYKDSSLIRIPKNIAKKQAQIANGLNYLNNSNAFIKKEFAHIISENTEELMLMTKHNSIFPRIMELNNCKVDFYEESTFADNIDLDKNEINLKKMLESKLKMLSQKEEYVLKSYFGFLASNEFTFQNIANELGMTKEGIRLVKNRALAKLRALIDEAEYLEYL